MIRLVDRDAGCLKEHLDALGEALADGPVQSCRLQNGRPVDVDRWRGKKKLDALPLAGVL